MASQVPSEFRNPRFLSSSQDTSCPAEFTCPISMEPMVDPVLCEDGHTYERANILEWISRSPTSPLTRQPLSVSNIRPNHALKASIQRWKVQQMNNNKKGEQKKEQAEPRVVIPIVTQNPIAVQPYYQSAYQQQQIQEYHQRVQQVVVQQQQQRQNTTNSQIVLQNKKTKIVVLLCVSFIFFIILSFIISFKADKHENDDD